MEHLIRDLLDAAAIETGRFPVALARRDAVSVVEEVVAQMAPMAFERALHLERQVVGPLPPVDCDGARLAQVMANLIGNAIKFTPPGGSIKLTAARDREAVRFDVSDTGPGIPEEALPHLWRAPVFSRYCATHEGRRPHRAS